MSERERERQSDGTTKSQRKGEREKERPRGGERIRGFRVRLQASEREWETSIFFRTSSQPNWTRYAIIVLNFSGLGFGVWGLGFSVKTNLNPEPYRIHANPCPSQVLESKRLTCALGHFPFESNQETQNPHVAQFALANHALVQSILAHESQKGIDLLRVKETQRKRAERGPVTMLSTHPQSHFAVCAYTARRKMHAES